MSRKSLQMHAVVALLLLVAGCANDPAGTAATPHSVSFVIAVDAPSSVHDVDWIVYDPSHTPIATGTVNAGESATVALDLAPGKYNVSWPNTAVTAGDISVAVAAQENTFAITDTTTVVHASATLEPLSSAAIFRAVIDSAPGDVPRNPTFSGSLEGNGKTSGFHTQTSILHDRLVPGQTYTATWPDTLSVAYRPQPDGFLFDTFLYDYPIRALQRTFVFTAPPAGWTAGFVQDVHYAVTGSFIFTDPIGPARNGMSYGNGAVGVWMENGQLKTLACATQSFTKGCGPFPVGIPVTLHFPPEPSSLGQVVATPDTASFTVGPVFTAKTITYSYDWHAGN